jgi:hypothetical protein
MHERLDRSMACATCGVLTPWIEIGFHAYVCPGPCTEALYDEFAEAVAALPEVDNPFEGEE